MSEIKDSVFAQVAGTVGRVFQYKNGTACVVEVKGEKSQYPDRVTVWGVDALDLGQGDRVQLKGWLSWMPDKYTKRDGSEGHGVAVSLNKPELLKREKAAAQADDAWAKTPAPAEWGGASAEQPF